jgi:PhzF family phenazine biosynthesis protein
MASTGRLYQLDVFSDKLFGGNPAAVCPLDAWLPDTVLQAIAAENNLSETAFYTPESNGARQIRWFTPIVEVDLCGHGTLAAAYAVFHYDGHRADTVAFASRSGALSVQRRLDGVLVLDFPADQITPAVLPEDIGRAFGRAPLEVYRGRSDYMLVFDGEDTIASLAPDFARLAAVPCRGVIVTAPGRQVDFVSRFFAPPVGIPEDPATGSAHTTLTPYWTARLGRRTLSARQLSQRQGSFECTLVGDRVHIGGRVTPYFEGRLVLPSVDHWQAGKPVTAVDTRQHEERDVHQEREPCTPDAAGRG